MTEVLEFSPFKLIETAQFRDNPHWLCGVLFIFCFK